MVGCLGWFVNCGRNVIRDCSGFLGACNVYKAAELKMVNNSRAGADRESALATCCVKSGSLYVCF